APVDLDVQEGPVRGVRIVDVGGEEQVVVDVIRGAPGPPGRVEERGTPVPRAEVDRRALVQHLLAFVGHVAVSPFPRWRAAGRPVAPVESSFKLARRRNRRAGGLDYETGMRFS